MSLLAQPVSVPKTCPSKINSRVPYVTSSVGRADFVMKSGLFLQQAESNFQLVVMTGSPVTGYLVVEPENDIKSIQFLTDLGNEKYVLAEVLTVAVEEDGGQFIASEPRRGWYGYGVSQDDAVKHFASALVEEYEVLSEREDRLSPSLRSDLAQLKQVVVPRR